MANNENTRAPAGGSEPTDQRARFEQWAESRGFENHERHPTGTYKDADLGHCWSAFKEGLASAPASAPLPLTNGEPSRD